MSGRGRNRPARFDGARGSSFRRPQQQQGASRLARGEAEPLALFKIERSRKKARGHLGRARMQGFLDRPQGIDIIARFDQCDAAGIEAELVQTMAMKPA